MQATAPVDHEKVVMSQMLLESFSSVVNMRVQISAMQAAMTEKDTKIADLEGQIASLTPKPEQIDPPR